MCSNSGRTARDDEVRQARLYLQSFDRTGFDYIFAPSHSALPAHSHLTANSAPQVSTVQQETLSLSNSFSRPPNLAKPKHSQSCKLHTSGDSDAILPGSTSSLGVRHDYRLHFLGLPVEISEIIYRFLFQGSKLYVFKGQMARIDRVNELAVYGMLSDVDTSILNTCKFIREEAIPILNTQTQLIIFDEFGRHDPLARLPCDLLRAVTTISVNLNTFVHINRDRLPALTRVRLLALHNFDHTFIEVVDQVVQTPKNIVPGLLWRVSDWRWKFKQFARLAQEEAFTIDVLLIMVIGRQKQPNLAAALIIIRLDLITRRCVEWKGVIGDKEVPIINKRRAELDWAAYGGTETNVRFYLST
ncbi:hypothetical protein LTR84_008527 [Exophiala bonariae]|uniref:Uncharacterized protein n=1 Tax=Exophiala bonariae TaxID=1690606 RepID=A0AAV9N097_9EURO|nr:hypothetical protein LTR84_008527 [Exophiala bonariae]